jgi:hypothetical protein
LDELQFQANNPVIRVVKKNVPVAERVLGNNPDAAHLFSEYFCEKRQLKAGVL